MVDGDMVFHFFKNDEVKARRDVADYWTVAFPRALEPVALAHFNVTADSGRLKAQHVYSSESPYTEREPLDSWWFRAYGFGFLLDPHRMALQFIEKLDQALEDATKSK